MVADNGQNVLLFATFSINLEKVLGKQKSPVSRQKNRAFYVSG